MLRKFHPLVFILLLAMIVRLGVLLAFPSIFDFVHTGSVQGSDAYDAYALNLRATGIYGRFVGSKALIPHAGTIDPLPIGGADALIPPLYSYVLAGLYATVGRGYLQVGILHILLDVLSILMLYHISKRIMPHGREVGLIVAFFYAAYPYLIFQNLTLIDTPIFMTLLYALTLCMVLLRDQPVFNRKTLAIAVTGGVILGLTVLSRPVIAPFAAAAALWFLFRLKWRQTLLRMAVVAVVSVITVAPWIVRNYSVYHTFVAVSNNSGMNFWFGNSKYTIPLVRAGYHPQWVSPDEPIDKNDWIANSQLFNIGMRYLRENPARIPELLWVKFLAYWSIDVFPTKNPVNGKVAIVPDASNNVVLSQLPNNDPVAVYSQPLFDTVGRLIHRLYFGALLLLAVGGLIMTIRCWRVGVPAYRP